jgi:hypothetical protein
MTEQRAMILAAVAFLVLTFVLLGARVLDAFFGAALGYVIGGFFFTWAAFRIERVWRNLSAEERLTDRSFKELRWFFIVSALFATTAVVPHYVLIIFSADAYVITIANWLSHLLLTLQIILAGRLVVSLYRVRLVPMLTILFAVLGAASLVANLIKLDTFATISGSAYPLLKPSLEFSVVQQLQIFLAITVPSLYLLREAYRLPKGSIRTSAYLLALGFLLGVLTAITVDFGSGNVADAIMISILATVYPFMVSLAGIRIARERSSRLESQ